MPKTQIIIDLREARIEPMHEEMLGRGIVIIDGDLRIIFGHLDERSEKAIAKSLSKN